MTELEYANLIADAARGDLQEGFELFVADENLPWKPRHGTVRMWIESQGSMSTTVDQGSGMEKLRVTFVAYTRENIGDGMAIGQTSALVNGALSPGCLLTLAPGSRDKLNGVAPRRTWIPGKDSHAYPGLFAAAALVTLDHYYHAAAAA